MEEEDPFILKEEPPKQQEEDPFVLKEEPPKQKEPDPFALKVEPPKQEKDDPFTMRPEPAHVPQEAPHSDVISPDVTLKDVLMPQVQSIQQKVSSAFKEKLEALVVNAVPQFPMVSLVLGVIAVGAGIAIPLGLYGMLKTMLVVLPLALVGAVLGYGMRSQRLSQIGLALAALSVLEALVCPMLFQQQKEANDAREAKELMDRTQKRGDELDAETKRRADAEARRIADEQAKHKAEDDARRAEDERRNAEWRKQQDEIAQKKAADEAKKAEALRQAKLKADEEARRLKAEQAAHEASEVKKAAAMEEAKTVYHDISVKVDDLTLALSKLETAAKVAKDEMERKAVYLERRNSPVPPPQEDLDKAQKSYDEWKGKLDGLKAQIPKAKADLNAASAEKQKASDTLDALQK